MGDLVQVRCYTNKNCKWKYGVVSARKGTLHYDVLIDGIRRTQHIDQMRTTAVQEAYLPKIDTSNIPISYDDQFQGKQVQPSSEDNLKDDGEITSNTYTKHNGNRRGTEFTNIK